MTVAWRVVRKKREKWSVEKMLRLAKAHHNGGVYFIVKTRRSVADLERVFRQREVASVLEENIGAIIGGGAFTSRGKLLMQLHREAVLSPSLLDDVKFCLAEIGVTLMFPVPVQQVR